MGGGPAQGLWDNKEEEKGGGGRRQEVKGALVLLSRGFVVKSWPQTLSLGTPGQALVHHTPLSVTTSHLAAQLTPHTATPPSSLLLSAPVTPTRHSPALGPSPHPPVLSSSQELARSPQPQQKSASSPLSGSRKVPGVPLPSTPPHPPTSGPGRSELRLQAGGLHEHPETSAFIKSTADKDEEHPRCRWEPGRGPGLGKR